MSSDIPDSIRFSSWTSDTESFLPESTTFPDLEEDIPLAKGTLFHEVSALVSSEISDLW